MQSDRLLVVIFLFQTFFEIEFYVDERLGFDLVRVEAYVGGETFLTHRIYADRINPVLDTTFLYETLSVPNVATVIDVYAYTVVCWVDSETYYPQSVVMNY